MELLEAVNYVMPYLGEMTVTSTDSRHPTVNLILKAIKHHTRLILSQGWWFNEREVTLYPSAENQMAAPDKILTLYSLDNEADFEVRNGMIFDLTNGTFTITRPVKFRLIEDLDFADLPLYAALYIQEQAGREVYVQDFGVESTIGEFDRKAKASLDMLTQENLRKRKFNTVKNHRAARMLRTRRV